MRVGSDRVLVAAAIAAAAFTAGVFFEPFRGIYGPLCHQLGERSLHVAGNPLAVCARCTGAYVGGAAGLAAVAWGLARLHRARLAWLIFAVVPSLVDVGVHLAGYSGAGNVLRALLALPAGFIAGLLLAEGIEDAVRMIQERRPAWSGARAGETSR